MKKIKISLNFVIGIIGFTLITNCTPEEIEPEPKTGNPKISIETDILNNNNNATLGINTPYQIKIIAKSNEDTNKELYKLIIQSYINNAINIDTSITLDQNFFGSDRIYFGEYFDFISDGNYSSKEVFTITITDQDGKMDTESFTINTIDPTLTEHHTGIILGAQSSTIDKIAYAVASNTVFTHTQANFSATYIDFMYVNSSSNDPTLAAPTSSEVSMYPLTIENETKMAISNLSSAEFDAIIDNTNFPTSISASEHINNFTVGTVIVFETVGIFKRKGHLKITEINTGDTGDITFEVKAFEEG